MVFRAFFQLKTSTYFDRKKKGKKKFEQNLEKKPLSICKQFNINLLSSDESGTRELKKDISFSLKQQIKWAVTKPPKIIKKPGINIRSQKRLAEKNEREWGNSIIGQTNNGQWSTLLGERLVYEILQLKGENPRKPEKKGGFIPDWETEDFIYEVKTSNWWVSGTAGEKVLGTWIKYQNIRELYGKPLRIVCVANQEYELEYGKIKYFGENVTEKTKQALELAQSWDIWYIKFSDLVSDFNYK